MNIQDLIIPYSELTEEKARAGCLVTDMPNEHYHNYKGISVSGLKQVMQSPAHYAYSEPKEQTPEMILGTAIHCAILEPERYVKDYMLLEECKNKQQPQYKAAVKAMGENLIFKMIGNDSASKIDPEELKEMISSLGKQLVLIPKDWQKVSGQVSAVQRNLTAMSHLGSGWPELSGFVECPDTGVIRRIRFDWLTCDLISLDLKKCQDARKEAFDKSIFNYGYHIQAAFYNDTFALIAGQPLKAFKYLAIEEKAPHGVRVRPCDDVSMHIGRQEYKPALELYAKCEDSDNWPAYEDAEEESGIPTWAVNQFMDQEEEGQQDG